MAICQPKYHLYVYKKLVTLDHYNFKFQLTNLIIFSKQISFELHSMEMDDSFEKKLLLVAKIRTAN